MQPSGSLVVDKSIDGGAIGASGRFENVHPDEEDFPPTSRTPLRTYPLDRQASRKPKRAAKKRTVEIHNGYRGIPSEPDLLAVNEPYRSVDHVFSFRRSSLFFFVPLFFLNWFKVTSSPLEVSIHFFCEPGVYVWTQGAANVFLLSLTYVWNI